MVSLSLPFTAIILLGMIIEIALPNLLRPDNLFSVTIAPESRHHPEVRALIPRWRISNAVIGLVTAGASAATFLLPQSSWTFFSMVGMQLGEWVILTLLGISLSVSRVASSTGAAGESYRHRWARLVFVIKTGTVILLGITDLLTTSNYQSGALARPIAALAIALNVAILALALSLLPVLSQH
ncbi:MAG: hypothetical protein ACJ8CB_25770 [Ktedonobacteraceae bacterium]